MQDPAQIAGRLQQFVTAVVGDPIYRRALRRQPAEALRLAGLPTEAVAGELAVQHYRISVHLDEPTLFGLSVPQANTREAPMEARLVLYGLKPLALLHGAEADMCRLAAWARSKRLTALLSPKEFTPSVDTDKATYSNLATELRPARAGSGAWRGLLVAQDSHQSMLGWLALLFGWDELLGRLLGYPQCCTAAFARNWACIRDQHRGDGAALLAINSSASMKYHPGANIFVRYFGYSLIEHFPCRLDCPATQAVAERMLDGLALFEPEEAQRQKTMLESTVVFTESDGIFVLPQARTENKGVATVCSYDSNRVLASTEMTATSRAIRSATSVEARGGELMAADFAFAGRLLQFAAATGGL